MRHPSLKRLIQSLIFVCLLSLSTGCYLHPSPRLVTGDASESDRMLASLSSNYFMGSREAKSQLPAVKLVLTSEVKKEIGRYTKGRKTVLQSYARRKKYERVLRAIFKEHGVPADMIALGLVESNYKPGARSHAGATGMWQFMKTTGRSYGLKINSRIDQRRDPVLSTIAAAHHLRDLYVEFNDWSLAMAAYNAGAGRVRRAIKKGRTRNFWTLARRGLLPRETRKYVPKIMAVMHIHNNPGAYGFPEIAAFKKQFKDLR